VGTEVCRLPTRVTDRTGIGAQSKARAYYAPVTLSADGDAYVGVLGGLVRFD
jgi:hypothetical protein